MNHNSYASSHEGESGNGSDYDKWHEIMSDVSSQEDSEVQRKPATRVEKLLQNIQSVKDFVTEKFGALSKEKLTKLVDSALVYVAKRTVEAVNKVGVRTEAENAEVQESVSSVVMQGAMEEVGVEPASEPNPILELNEGETKPELNMSIRAFIAEDATLKSGESVAGVAARVIERDKKWDLEKVSGAMGSNEGGWYERPTGERYYVKFYENPDQGRVEFITNAIYQKLGIKAARSEIIQLGGREAIASPAVPEATPVSVETQKNSQDMRNGFVADAFLANWDVVGLAYDNIVKGEGGLYRIDNGGAMIFRAQGGDKTYSPDSIPELTTMREPGRPTGEVFKGLTEQEIGRQAQNLVTKLAPEDIRAIVDESGITGENRDRILTGLLGRREFLAKTYGETGRNPEVDQQRPRRRVSEAIQALKTKEAERTGEMVVWPKTEIVCDHDQIEDQRIDVINKDSQGVTELRFKLRAEACDNARIAMTNAAMNNTIHDETGKDELVMPSGAVLSRNEKIIYDGASSDESQILCKADALRKDGVTIFIANDAIPCEGRESVWSFCNDSKRIRTAMGLVKVEAPLDMDAEKVEQIVGEMLEKDLGISDAFDDVPEQAEEAYKVARYKWQHKISGELTPEQEAQAGKLERAEVFPGYSTFIEKGKHKEYLEKYGEDLRAVHYLSSGDAESIYRILTMGLMSSTERYSRGALTNGLSSCADMDSGGADNVFTRMTDKAHRDTMVGAVVTFKPELFDRTDYYSYPDDYFGSTDDSLFAQRLSPDEIMASLADHDDDCSDANEQMFRTGIGANFIESIQVPSADYDKVIEGLRSRGVTEFDGRPIEEVITTYPPERDAARKALLEGLDQKLAQMAEQQ